MSQTWFFLDFFAIWLINSVLLIMLTVTNINLMIMGGIPIVPTFQIGEKYASISAKIQWKCFETLILLSDLYQPKMFMYTDQKRSPTPSESIYLDRPENIHLHRPKTLTYTGKSVDSRRRRSLHIPERRLECLSREAGGQKEWWMTRKAVEAAKTMEAAREMAAHSGPEQPRIQSEVLGHSLVSLLVRSHRSLVELAPPCSLTPSLTRRTVNN